MPLPPLSRRQFLRRLALAAGISYAAGMASGCGPLFAPSIDSAYLDVDRRHRASNLITGQIPESWKTLAQEQLMPRLQAEVATVILPEVTRVLGGDAREIAARTEYDTDEAQVRALIQNYGEANVGLATQMAMQGIGLTVSRFNETRTAPDKRIAINTSKILELGKAQLQKEKATDPATEKLNINTFVVQSVVDAVIHEATHYVMEVDLLPRPGDLERVQAMYEGGAIGTVEVQKLLYFEGAQLAFISRGGYKYYLNKALTEIFRAYVMQRVIEDIESDIVIPTKRFGDTVYFLDAATNEIMDFIHASVGLKRPAPPLSAFKNDLLRIIDYYQDPVTLASQVSEKKIRLTDRDFVRIFGLFESFYASIGEAITVTGGKDLMVDEMKFRAKFEIGKVIDEAKERS